jgi:hypothetical protein
MHNTFLGFIDTQTMIDEDIEFLIFFAKKKLNLQKKSRAQTRPLKKF